METDVYFGSEAEQKLHDGIETVYKAVSVTLGSRGKNAVYTRWQQPHVTNDGVSIARKIRLTDKAKDMGAELLKRAAEQTNFEAGDGTTTAIILAYHLIEEGKKILASDKTFTSMKLRKELEEALLKATEYLSKHAHKVETIEELKKIAMISSEDASIANLVAEAVEKVGETGRVIAQETQGLKIEIEEIKGMEWEGGYLSAAFITDPMKMEVNLKDIHAVITDKSFNFVNDILPFIKHLIEKGISRLALICADAQSEALATMVVNKLNADKGERGFQCFAIKAPRDPEMMKDLGALIGKGVYSESGTVKKLSVDNVAIVQQIIASQGKTLIIKGDRTEQEEKMYMERVSAIKQLMADASQEARINYEDRLARITGSIVLIKVGASTDTEMKYLYAKIEDAINAVKAAKKEGYVAGGGITLRHIGREVHKKLKTTGSKIFSLATDKPVEVLVKNSGGEFNADLVNATDGYDTDKGEYVKDVLSLGIIDPVLVEKSALKYAVSLAGIYLTIETLLVDVPPKKE